MVLRILSTILLVSIAVPATVWAQDWYRLYDQGVAAFREGKFDESKEKLTAAKRLSAEARSPVRQGQKVLFYGVRYDEYIPDYYLGLIALREQRLKDAAALLEGVQTAKLLAANDKVKQQELARALTDTRQQLAKATAPTPGPASPTSATPAAPAWQADFQRALLAGESALKEERFGDARTAANTARESAKDTRSQADLAAFERRIQNEEGRQIANLARAAITKGSETDAQMQIQRLAALNPQYPGIEQLRSDLTDLRTRKGAETIVGRVRGALGSRNATAAAQEIARLAGTNPQHPALGQLRNELATLEASLKAAASTTGTAEALRRRRDAEVEVMRLFYNGDYSGARTRVRAFAETPSERMHLYLACSQAALALLSNDSNLAAEARKTFALAKPAAGQLATDMSYISPAILKLLNSGAR
jgi:hypothetical protein